MHLRSRPGPTPSTASCKDCLPCWVIPQGVRVLVKEEEEEEEEEGKLRKAKDRAGYRTWKSGESCEGYLTKVSLEQGEHALLPISLKPVP